MWTLSTTTKNYISEKEKKYSFSTRTRTTSTFTTTLPGKTLIYPASIWTRRKTCGWEPPAMVFTACRTTSNSLSHHERKHSQHLRRLIQRTVDCSVRSSTVSAQTHYRQFRHDPKNPNSICSDLSEAAAKIIWEIYGSELSTA